MEDNNISGTPVKRPIEVPDILTQANKEIFRRRLLIGSRVIAILLIFVLAYFSYSYYEVGSAYKNRPCWSCGYYYGKQCNPIILHGQYKTNRTYIDEYRLSIAEYNDIPVNISIYTNDPNDVSLSDILNSTNKTQ